MHAAWESGIALTKVHADYVRFDHGTSGTCNLYTYVSMPYFAINVEYNYAITMRLIFFID